MSNAMYLARRNRFPRGDNGFYPAVLVRDSDLSPEVLADLRARQSLSARPARPKGRKSRFVFADFGPHGEAHPRNRKVHVRKRKQGRWV